MWVMLHSLGTTHKCVCFVALHSCVTTVGCKSPDQNCTDVSLYLKVSHVTAGKLPRRVFVCGFVCVVHVCLHFFFACVLHSQTLRWADRFMALQKHTALLNTQPALHQGRREKPQKTKTGCKDDHFYLFLSFLTCHAPTLCSCGVMNNRGVLVLPRSPS